MKKTEKRFVYEAEFTRNELGGYDVFYPDIPDAFTFGKNLNQSIGRAASVLQLILAEMIDDDKPIPLPIFRGHSEDVFRVAVSVEVTPKFIEQSKCMTVTEAAKELGVTKGRITHMLDAGVLKPVLLGSKRVVTIASVSECKARSRKAGRPKNEAKEDEFSAV